MSNKARQGAAKFYFEFTQNWAKNKNTDLILILNVLAKLKQTMNRTFLYM
jgi:hypothetical protein